jgi:hypothetical protein
MKAKAMSGSPLSSNRLQRLQSAPSSLEEKYFSFRSEVRYVNSCDWRDWSPKEGHGFSPNYESKSTPARSLAPIFGVANQCLRKWMAMNPLEKLSGLVCICGHPEPAHADGGLCSVGPAVCVCRKPKAALWVDDLRFFYRVTKGAHEAHALVLGLQTLLATGGSATRSIDWVCDFRNCGGSVGVNPARFRNSTSLTLHMSVHDMHKLICEPCLFRELNGGYIYE